MSILIPIAAALAFACDAPEHHDGDAIRCAGQERAMRLHAIDAPEIPGACRPGRQCTPGDPYAARDYLRSLTQGRTVRCEEKDVDAYGRRVVRCTADGEDLACAMVAAGHAVERYGRLDCNGPSLLPENAVTAGSDIGSTSVPQRWAATAGGPIATERNSYSWWPLAALLLALYNCFGVFAFQRHQKASRRTAPRFWTSAEDPAPGPAWLMALAITGAAPGMVAAALVIDRPFGRGRFHTVLIVCAGVQIGMLAGLWLAGLAGSR